MNKNVIIFSNIIKPKKSFKRFSSEAIKWKPVLDEAVKDLTQRKNMKILMSWTINGVGIYAYTVSITESSPELKGKTYEQRLILFARTLKPRGMITTLIDPIIYAAKEDIPIILAWKPQQSSKIEYYFFDAEQILET